MINDHGSIGIYWGNCTVSGSGMYLVSEISRQKAVTNHWECTVVGTSTGFSPFKKYKPDQGASWNLVADWIKIFYTI